MAIQFKRFKKVSVCGEEISNITSNGGNLRSCWEEEYSIREWDFSPPSVQVRWAENNPIPTSQAVTITFPEVEKSVDLKENYTNFRYVIKKDATGGYTAADVVDLQAIYGENLQQIAVTESGKIQFKLIFKNFDRLKSGDNLIALYLGIIATNKQGQEVEIESRSYSVLIKKVAENEVNTPYIATDKQRYYLTYIKSTGELLGDTSVRVRVHNLPLYKGSFRIAPTLKAPFNTIDEETENQSVKIFQLIGNYNWRYQSEGTRTVRAVIRLSTEKGTFTENIWLVIQTKNEKENIPVAPKPIENQAISIHFCLDKHKIILRKHSPQAQSVKVTFTMTFQSYSNPAKTISQAYQYVFFGDEITLFPGDEVQDFFPEITSLENLNINENSIVSPQNLFQICQTELIVNQYDTNGNLLNTDTLPTLYFLPGRKPAAFPFLTNGKIRRTYTDSLVSLSGLQEDFIGKELYKIAGNSVDISAITNPKMVVNMAFYRKTADPFFGERKIIEKQPLTLLPITNPQRIINVLFQNQNHCPDWFSFSGEWELHEEFTQNIATNLKNGNDFKANVERKTTLKINTGWILEEEVTLLSELIVSPVCFIKGIGQQVLGNRFFTENNSEWIKAIPINKKSLVFDSEQITRSFVVEFLIIERD